MNQLSRFSLLAGAAVPITYFGAQALAAPFFPEFSVFQHTASLLGSNLSTRPGVLNTGAAVTGLVALFACIGPTMVTHGQKARFVGVVISLCFASFGLASLWAASFPLPNPNHNPGALAIGLFVAPFAALLAAFSLRLSTGVRVYAILNLVAFVLVACAYSGIFGFDQAAYAGLLQRIGTLVMLVPLAVISIALYARAMTTSLHRRSAA